jgi:hypothetical protein
MEILIPLDQDILESNTISFERENGEIQVRYCPTELMIADVLTKPIHGNRQRQLKNEMLGEE